MCVCVFCYGGGGCFIGVNHNSISFENIFKEIGTKEIYIYICMCECVYGNVCRIKVYIYIYKYQIFLLFCTIIDEYDDT